MKLEQIIHHLELIQAEQKRLTNELARISQAVTETAIRVAELARAQTDIPTRQD